MKKISVIIALLLSIQKVKSQIIFCPPGAEWHYSFFAYGTSSLNEQIKYLRDSIVNSETVKVLLHTRYYKSQNFGQAKLTLIRQRGDTVFVRNQFTQHAWQILYNFSASPGQGWINNIGTATPIIPPGPTPVISYSISVDSVKNIVVNSFNLRRLYVKYSSYSTQVSTFLRVDSVTIDERIGCNQFLFNFYNVKWNNDADEFSDFLCYSDNTFGTKQFGSILCSYVDHEGISENYKNRNIKIYPNPANNIVTIDTNDELINDDSFVSIKDLCGREIKQLTISNLYSDPGKINISDLAKGVYILNLSNNNEVVYTGKLVKSE